MSATGLALCTGMQSSSPEVNTEIPTHLWEDQTSIAKDTFFFFFKDQDPGAFNVKAQLAHGQVMCLCTQLQIRHAMVVVITGSNPVSIKAGIFHSAKDFQHDPT